MCLEKDNTEENLLSFLWFYSCLDYKFMFVWVQLQYTLQLVCISGTSFGKELNLLCDTSSFQKWRELPYIFIEYKLDLLEKGGRGQGAQQKVSHQHIFSLLRALLISVGTAHYLIILNMYIVCIGFSSKLYNKILEYETPRWLFYMIN